MTLTLKGRTRSRLGIEVVVGNMKSIALFGSAA